jgi:hypothetical protein
VGFLLARRWREDAVGYVDLLAVHPQWQRQGLGSSLLEAALTALPQQGFGKRSSASPPITRERCDSTSVSACQHDSGSTPTSALSAGPSLANTHRSVRGRCQIHMARLRDHAADDQHDAGDQPRNGIEVLIAAARRRRMPARGSGSISLHVRDEKRQLSRSYEQAER